MAESRIFNGSSWITITDEEHRNASDPHPLYALADGTRGAFAAPLGPDDNYVTDAEKVKLANLSPVATSGAYADLTGTPTIPDSPDDIGAAPAAHDHTVADIDSGAATDGHILTADGAGGAAWEAPPAGGGGGGSVVPLAYPAGVYTALPGYPVIARDIPVSLAAANARYFPMRLDTARTLEEVAISVTTLAAGSTVHVALYADPNAAMQPGARIAAIGAGFDTSTAGPKIASGLALSLTAGNYVWVVLPAGGAPALLGYRVATPMLGTTVSNQIADRFELSAATSPPPDPGDPWTKVGLGTSPFPVPLWLGWSA